MPTYNDSQEKWRNVFRYYVSGQRNMQRIASKLKDKDVILHHRWYIALANDNTFRKI